MINGILESFYNFALNAVESLPEIDGFNVLEVAYEGVGEIFQFVGWLMPYSIYSPLITFILSLTAFRIAYAVYLHFKKNN